MRQNQSERSEKAPRLRRQARRYAAPPRAVPRETSRRTEHRAASPRSASRAGSRRAGSSFRSLLGEKGGEVDRVTLQFLEKNQQAMVRHPLRGEDPVEMVAFLLDDPGVNPFDLALDDLSVEAGAAIAHPQMPRYDSAQPGNREAALPTERPLMPDGFDHRVHERRQILRDIAGHAGEPLLPDPENDDPVGFMDLRGSDAGAAGVLHGFDHILNEAAHPGRRRILDW